MTVFKKHNPGCPCCETGDDVGSPTGSGDEDEVTNCCCANVDGTSHPTVEAEIDYGTGTLTVTLHRVPQWEDTNCVNGGGGWIAQSWDSSGQFFEVDLNFLQIRFLSIRCTLKADGALGYLLTINQNACNGYIYVLPDSGACTPLSIVFTVPLLDPITGAPCAINGITEYTITITP